MAQDFVVQFAITYENGDNNKKRLELKTRRRIKGSLRTPRKSLRIRDEFKT